MGEGGGACDVVLFQVDPSGGALGYRPSLTRATQAPPEECRLFVSNVPSGTQLDTVWDVFGTVGPVCEVALLNEARDGSLLAAAAPRPVSPPEAAPLRASQDCG